MQHSILAVLGAAILAWVVTAARQRSVHSLTFSQAIVFTFFKFVYGIRFSGFDSPADMQGPLVFVVLAQSSLDRTLLKCFLPAGTFHIVAGEGDKSQQQALVKSVLVGRGTICLYFPPQVEASPETMTLLTELGTIASQAGARIMPVYIRGTRFSRFSSWEESKAPRSLLPQITITGGPVSNLGTTEGIHIADALLDAMTLAKFRSVNLSQNLVEALVSSAKLYGTDRTILEDALGGKLDYKTLLIGIRALAGRIHPLSKPGEAIGILLPNSNGVVVTLFSVISAGRVAAMLNYTAGPAAVVSAINTAAIRIVICSKAFVEKADLHEMIARVQENGTKIVHIEEIRDGIRPIEKIRAFFHWRKQLVRTAAEDPAVILFTSGSEGTPKGVVLSSRNLIANAAQADCRVDISATDTLFNVLPIFHSFGLLGGTLLPLLYGIRLFLYPSPLHYKIIPGVARKVAPTIMFGTDTFLNGYARAAKEGDFDSLRLLVAGAEAVKPETRNAYRQRFAAEIVEGYGMTEASPVVGVNSATFSKDGSVGRLFPGMEMRLEPVEGIAEGGRFFVAGPNVMLGYLLSDKPGVVQPLATKWHDSGDIVSVDDRGFITIKGRAKRFAKIAGEMVSLGAVEMMVQQLWPEANHAAVSLPDKRKGERIVLVTTQSPALKEELLAYSRRFGATELMVPADIVNVDSIPVLGSGKIDYATAQKLVVERISR